VVNLPQCVVNRTLLFLGYDPNLVAKYQHFGRNLCLHLLGRKVGHMGKNTKWGCAWATVAQKMAGMSVRKYEQESRRIRGKKNIFERQRGEKKFRGANERKKFSWIVVLKG
jgi:hypothetical protein